MKSKSTFIIIIVAVIIILFAWYYFSKISPTGPSVSQPQSGTVGAGDKTSDIANDLNQMPDNSAATQEMNSLDQNLKNF